MSWLCPRCRTRFEEALERCPHDGKRVVEDLTGHTIGDRYSLREVVGIGGMGSTVWLAWQSSTHRTVAVKLLPPANAADAERFARGARIASNLNHPNITTVHDYGQTPDGKLYLVMELLEGTTLRRLLKQTGALPAVRALDIADQTLRALEAAHRKHVVHRDLKPGNLFVTRKNEERDFVKVLDFGIATFMSDVPDGEASQLASRLGSEVTEERQVCGTPQYMAPEQVAFGDVDARTDLYAMGIVLYRMLVGRLPFQSRNHRELFRQHLGEDPPAFGAVRPDLDVPCDLEAFVMRALAKAPEERFASAAEMRSALRQIRRRLGVFSDDEETPASGPGWATTDPPDVDEGFATAVRPSRRRAWMLVALLLLLAGGGVAAWRFLAEAPTTPAPTQPAVVTIGSRAVADAALAEATPPDAGPAAPVVITSAPAGAEVRNGEEVLGRTPFDGRLPAGTYVLTLVLDGHAPAQVELDLNAGDAPQSRNVELVATAAPRPKPAPRARRWRPAPKRPASPERATPEPAAPEPAAPTPAIAAAPEPAAAPAPATVKVKLLDETQSRDFPIAGEGARPREEPQARPAIKLLDDGPAPKVDLLE